MAVANDALLHLKQIFSHGIRLSITNSNPASAFKNKHAGGTEISRNRNLNLKEIETTFTIFRKYKNNFVLENYIAMSILLILGVRKTELTQAKWEEFNFKITDTNTEIIWELPAIRSKTGKPIAIPIPMQLNNLLKILKVLSLGSDYLFPSRRSGKKGHISDDTLNHALANLFGKRTGKANSSTGDVLGAAEIKYFVIHDLRRTCRTLLQVLKVTDNVAEKCLNHTLSGVKGVYNQYDYFDERKEALQKLADLVFPYIDNPDIFMNFK
jgi:integrase